jgi:hypothetical protein
MTMSNTLSLLDRTPDWVEALCREIDTLKFASAFDTFTPDAILAFGVKQITGVSAMQAFYVKIDSPLNIDHRILEVWDGEATTLLQGPIAISSSMSTASRPTACRARIDLYSILDLLGLRSHTKQSFA